MYSICFISANLKDESFRKFLETGRSNSIKKQILKYLIANSAKAYTAEQLQLELGIKYRSSVCHPLFALVESGLIQVVEAEYNHSTGREVGLYQLSKTLFS